MKDTEKKVYSFWEKKRTKKVFGWIYGTFCAIFFFVAICCACVSEWTGLLVSGVILFFYAAIGFLIVYALSYRRVEFYADRVVLIGEQSWPKPRREARYQDIVGACINAADEYGDHVRGGKWERDLDTLCVYCKKGEYILYGIEGWGKQYCRELLAEILSRANVSESEPEAGEYGAGSAEAQNGFAEPGVAEEDIQFYAAIEEAV